jgi:hypothetical protein
MNSRNSGNKFLYTNNILANEVLYRVPVHRALKVYNIAMLLA